MKNNISNDSICCGATINELGLCSECFEHTDPVIFEGSDGDIHEMACDGDGILQPIDKLKGKLAVAFAVVAVVMFAFGFYIASAIAASNAIAGGR